MKYEFRQCAGALAMGALMMGLAGPAAARDPGVGVGAPGVGVAPALEWAHQAPASREPPGSTSPAGQAMSVRARRASAWHRAWVWARPASAWSTRA